MGERQRRNLWTLLPWRGAVAGRGGASAVAQGDGARNDLLHSGDLLVSGRSVGRILAGLDLAQHCARAAPPSQRLRPEDRRGGGTIVGAGWSSGASRSSVAPVARFQGRGPLVLRMDAAPARRPILELRSATRSLRQGERGGAQPLRLVR